MGDPQLVTAAAEELAHALPLRHCTYYPTSATFLLRKPRFVRDSEKRPIIPADDYLADLRLRQ